jgi:aspartate oxidase
VIDKGRMSSDRTSEFFSLARSVPSTPISSGQNTAQQQQQHQQQAAKSAANKNPAFHELRTFHQQAAGISRDIASTSALLAELTHAVRHKSMFQDDTATVNHLVVRIKTSIENLNARLETADRTIQQQKRVLGTVKRDRKLLIW